MTASTLLPIRHAYRALFKAALVACQYSTPARYQVRSTMRRAFRTSPASSYNPERVANTLRLLKSAAERTGIEHKIVKNILRVRYWQAMGDQMQWKPGRMAIDWNSPEVKAGYRTFDQTIEMLNQTMGLCLK